MKSPRRKFTEDLYELSPIQQGMLFHHLCDEHSGVDIEQMVIELHEPLDVAAFEKAWRKVVERHAVLRTGFRWERLREPVQEVWRGVDISIERHDWRSVSAAEQAEATEAYLRLDRRRGFDLREAPLMRLALFRLGEADFRLIWTFHHTLIDGRSFVIILKEVFSFYEAICRGETVELEQPRPYRQYIEWLRRLDHSAAAKFWQQKLLAVSAPTPLLQDWDRTSVTDEGDLYGGQEIRLSEALSSALRSLAEQENLTLNTFIQGAWAVLLSRYSGEKDIVFGATKTARRSTVEGAESIVGLLLNTLPVRVRVSDEIPVLTWLKQLRSEWISLRRYEHTPLVKIREWSEFPANVPLFDSLVVFENRRFDSILCAEGGPWQWREFRLLEQTNYALTLAAYGDREVLLKIEYDRRRFEPSTITRMLGHLRTLLDGMVATPAQALADLQLLTEAERHQLLVEWNDTSRDYAADLCLHQLIEAQVERSPDSLALVYERQKLSYREMNARANQLAHNLRALGVGPEVSVAICMERSLDMVVGVLAILKAGGAYVPLDPTYPRERLAFMLEDSRVPVLLTQQPLLEILPRHCARSLCLDMESWATADASVKNPASGVVPENLAYVIYTSGSTGRPKGVQLTHRGLCNLVETQVRTCGVQPGHRVLQFCSLSFDPSIFEIGAALGAGATLCLGSRNSLLPGRELFELLHDQAITTIVLPPSVLSPLPDGLLPSLHTLIVGAEPVTSEFVRRWGTCRRIFNIYGATETTVFSTIAEIRDDGRKPLIGRPIANTRVYLLDSGLRPVPVGVPGELYVGGVGLARGYLNRPELTAARFIPDQFANEPGARLYRTGDLARYLPNGNIDFLGRIDCQVKVRGHRIELEEIEAVLAQHSEVRESVVVAREDIAGDKRLVAYVVPKEEQAPTPGHLRSFLKTKLPEYMVPSAFVLLDALPLSSNGKVDRRALTLPEQSHFAKQREKEFIAPKDAVESQLVEIWEEVLGTRPIGVRDNFFESGGHSLLVTKLLCRTEQAFGMRLSMAGVFQSPTVEQMAALLRDKTSPPKLPRAVAIQPEGSRPPFFCVGGGPRFLNLAHWLGSDQPFLGLGLQESEMSQLPIPYKLEDIAGHIVRAMRELQPQGPYYLGGWCEDGIIAYETARQLVAQQGEQVGLLALFDAQNPAYLERFNSKGSRWELMTHNLRFHLANLRQLEMKPALHYILDRLKDFRQNVKRIMWQASYGLRLRTGGRLRDMNQILYLAASAYRPQPYPGRVTIFQAAERPLGRAWDLRLGWRELVSGGLDVHEIPGDHASILLEPNVAILASKMIACMRKKLGRKPEEENSK